MRIRAVCLSLVSVVACLLGVGVAAASAVTRQAGWCTDGSIKTVIPGPGVVYVGGSFSRIGACSGAASVYPVGSAVAQPGWPAVHGTVMVVVSDAAGGFYVGGSFSFVGAVGVSNIAHLRANHTVDTAFTPNPDGAVSTIVLAGGTVWFSGAFGHVAGVSRPQLAAVDATRGGLLATRVVFGWRRGAAPGLVLSVSGSTVYFAGGFTSVDGQPRAGLAALDSTQGLLTGWAAATDAPVRALVAGGGGVFIAGRFTTVNGVARAGVAKLDATTGATLAWTTAVPAGVGVDAAALDGSVLYLASAMRAGMASVWAVGATGGAPTGWQTPPLVSTCTGAACQGIVGIVVTPDAVYLAGGFDEVGGPSGACGSVAVFSRATGIFEPSSPCPGVPRIAGVSVFTTGPSAGLVYVAAPLAAPGLVASVARSDLAAISTRTGLVTAWNPRVGDGFGSSVNALALHGSKLYVGGVFGRVGHVRRTDLAVISTTNGRVGSWNPRLVVGAGQVGVTSLAAAATTIYAAGAVVRVNGVARRYLAAISIVNGRPATLDAKVTGGPITTLALAGRTLYIAGRFSRVGRAARRGLAAIDTRTGRATAWVPPLRIRVAALVVRATTVYIAGAARATGQPLLAAVNTTTGRPTGWRTPLPAGQASVTAVANDHSGLDAVIPPQASSAVAVFGAFMPPPSPVMISPTTGAATPYNPFATSSATALAVAIMAGL
jgi:hypothetical protein